MGITTMKKPEFTRRDFLAGTAATTSLLAAPLPLWAADDEDAGADNITLDANYLTRPWKATPYDPSPLTYTFEEIEKHWDKLLRGYQISFPSAEYLRKRYQRYPQLWKELKFQDEDYAMHSRNVLEVWLLFFRGDLQQARNLGLEYGGFARIPAIFSQIVYAIYLAESLKEKHTLLQDAARNVTDLGTIFQPRPGDDADYRADYALIRLGYTYAMCRIAEDVSIGTALLRDYVGKVFLASNDILAVYPEHPLGLALSAGIHANIIRRGGKLASGIVFGANVADAKGRFETSFSMVPDMALTRFEYANTLLYIDSEKNIDESIAQLEMASNFVPLHAVEALDIAYAKKRLAEVQDFKTSGSSFFTYDRRRRKYQNKGQSNLYDVLAPPFLFTQWAG